MEWPASPIFTPFHCTAGCGPVDTFVLRCTCCLLHACIAGYDPSEQRGRRSGQLLVGLGAAADSDSDSNDEEDEQLQQLRKVTLLPAPDLPGRFWACHDQGCRGINIRWLQQLNGGNAEDGVGLFGSSSGSSWVQQRQQEGQEQQLPAPAVQELLVSGPGVCSSCVVGNALFGSGCIVLEQQQQQAGGSVVTQPRLVYLKPRPTGVLGEGVVGAAAAGAAATGEGEEEDALGEEELLLTPEELDTRGRQQVRSPGWWL